MTGRGLQAVVKVRPGEGRTVSLLMAVMVIGWGGAAVGAAGVESLFFSRFGPDFLPVLYLALGPATFAVMAGLGALLARQAGRALVRLPLLLAAVLLGAWGLLALDLRWYYPALWLLMMIVWTSQGLGSWALAGAVSDTRQAKRLFPLYGAGLILGGVIGGLATAPLAAWIHAERLLLVWAGSLVVTFLLAGATLGTSARPTRAARPRRRAATRSPRLAQGFRDLARQPMLRWMAISMVLLAVLYFTLALQFARGATARFPEADRLAGFLGLFMGAANGAGLLVSLLVANRLFAWLGVPTGVLALALIYLGGFGVLAVGSTFALLVGFRFLQMVWVNGVWATGWQALFNVVPAEQRARVRTFMDGGPLQAGVMLSGVLLILADRVLTERSVYVIGVVAAGVAVWSTWRLRRAYGGALVQALRAGNPDVFRPEQEPFGGFRQDADAHAALIAGVSDTDPAVRRVSTEILADLGAPGSTLALVEGLRDGEADVRAASLRGLARAGDRSTRDPIEPLLRDPEPTVRLAAIDALEAAAGWPDPSLRVLLADPDPGVRARAAGALLGRGWGEAEPVLMQMGRDARPQWRAAAIEALGRAGTGTDEVAAGLADEDPSVRREAATSLATLDSGRAVDPLIGALGDEDPTVRDAAAASLARIGPPAEAALVEALARPDREAGALVALAGIGGPPPEALGNYARDQAALAIRYHGLWLALRSHPDERMGLLAHSVLDRAQEHGLNALRAVTRGHDAEAIEVAIENLSSRDPQQRANALEAIEAAGAPDLVRPLLAVWDAPAPSPSDGAASVEELLGDPDPWLRACAALAAGGVGGPLLASRVGDLARSDDDPLVRNAATTSLKGDGVETLSTLPLLERVLFLRKVPLFADLSAADLKHVAEVATEHAYPDGEVIADQGEAGDEMHIVVSGEIQVLVEAGDGDGREVARRIPGEYVGEMAIISEESRMASLVCLGPVRTLSLDRRSFQRILRDRPDASLAVMRVLCDRLRESHTSAAGR